MLKTGDGHGIAFSLLLVGGHVVAGELLHKRAGAAVYVALGVAACVLVFVAAEALLAFARKRGEGGRGLAPRRLRPALRGGFRPEPAARRCAKARGRVRLRGNPTE